MQQRPSRSKALLTRRVRFIPETRDGLHGYRLEGEGTLRPLMEAFVPHVASGTGTDGMYVKEGLVQEVASPAGVEPASPP
jgi:hypothetical protein